MAHGAHLFLLVGPAGVGKNTLMNAVLSQLPNLAQLPTATTRPPRPGEQPGRERFFVSEEEFDHLLRADAFVEWQPIHGYRYGTLKSVLERRFETGNDFIADVDVLGATLLKERDPDHVTVVYVLPPSLSVLESRIRNRSVESGVEVDSRLSRAKFELSLLPKADYLLINDDLETAVIRMLSIISIETHRDVYMNADFVVPTVQNMCSVTATAAIMSDDRMRVLVIHRRADDAMSPPSLPSYPVEHGQFAHETLRREAEKDMGLTIEIGRQDRESERRCGKGLIVPSPASIRVEESDSTHRFELLYACTVSTRNEGPESMSRARWCSLSEIDGVVSSEDARVIRQLAAPDRRP